MGLLIVRKLKNPRTNSGCEGQVFNRYQAQTAAAPERGTSTIEIRMRPSAWRPLDGLLANWVRMALAKTLMSAVFLKCDAAKVKGQLTRRAHYFSLRCAGSGNPID